MEFTRKNAAFYCEKTTCAQKARGTVKAINLPCELKM